jgi:hypothetical protein
LLLDFLLAAIMAAFVGNVLSPRLAPGGSFLSMMASSLYAAAGSMGCAFRRSTGCMRALGRLISRPALVSAVDDTTRYCSNHESTSPFR